MNDTGSFPDESEKTPMCFIKVDTRNLLNNFRFFDLLIFFVLKCLLENAGVVSGENKINKEMAVSFYQLDNEDLADDCINEMSMIDAALN